MKFLRLAIRVRLSPAGWLLPVMRSTLLVFALALLGCQSKALIVNAPSCASTCTGCCDLTGACLPGNSSEACGAPGDLCLACGAGEFCAASRSCLPVPDAGVIVLDAGTSVPDAGMTPCPPDGWCVDGLDANGAQLTHSHLRSVWARASNDVWVVGDMGTILHFDGTRWAQSASGVTDDLFGVWAASASDVWAVGGSGDPTQLIGVVMHFDGTTWAARERGIKRIDAVWGVDGANVWFAGVTGAMHHWDGVSFTAVPSGTTRDIVDLAGSGTDRVWAVGSWGLILAFDGTTWSEVPTSVQSGFTSALAFGPSLAWVAGGNGLFGAWDGTAWQTSSIGQDVTVMGLWGARPDAVWSVGPEGDVRFFNGRAPQRKVSNTTQFLRDVHGSDERSVWAVGFNGTVLRYRP